MPVQIGLQLYTLREACAKNLAETLSQVAELGYQGVEFAGFYGYSAVEVRRMLRQFNLHPISSHVRIDDLRHRLPEVLTFHQEIGCDYILCPWVDPEIFQDGNRARSLIELENRLDGEIALDALYRRTDAQLFWLNWICIEFARVERMNRPTSAVMQGGSLSSI